LKGHHHLHLIVFHSFRFSDRIGHMTVWASPAFAFAQAAA
jgi:hypothetical protein